MTFAALVLSVTALFVSYARAQMLSTIVFDKHHVGFTGPVDIVASPIQALLMRAASTAIANTGTQSLVDLRRVSDNATCTMHILANGSGGADVSVGTPCNSNTQTVTAWIGASSAAVSKWYDQSGNGRDVAQGSPGSQPMLTLSCTNGSPCISFSSGVNSTVLPLTVGVPTSNQPFTISGVSQRTAAFTSFGSVFDGFNTASGSSLGYSNATNTARCAFAPNAVTATAADSTWHAIMCIANGASPNSMINVDGTPTTFAGGTGILLNTFEGIGARNTGAGSNTNLGGDITEVLIWSSAVSSGDQTSLCHNQRLYYSTAGSC